MGLASNLFRIQIIGILDQFKNGAVGSSQETGRVHMDREASVRRGRPDDRHLERRCCIGWHRLRGRWRFGDYPRRCGRCTDQHERKRNTLGKRAHDRVAIRIQPALVASADCRHVHPEGRSVTGDRDYRNCLPALIETVGGRFQRAVVTLRDSYDYSQALWTVIYGSLPVAGEILSVQQRNCR